HQPCNINRDQEYRWQRENRVISERCRACEAFVGGKAVCCPAKYTNSHLAPPDLNSNPSSRYRLFHGRKCTHAADGSEGEFVGPRWALCRRDNGAAEICRAFEAKDAPWTGSPESDPFSFCPYRKLRFGSRSSRTNRKVYGKDVTGEQILLGKGVRPNFTVETFVKTLQKVSPPHVHTDTKKATSKLDQDPLRLTFPLIGKGRA